MYHANRCQNQESAAILMSNKDNLKTESKGKKKSVALIRCYSQGSLQKK